MHNSNGLHWYQRQRSAPYIYVYIIYIIYIYYIHIHVLYLNNKSQYGGILFPNLIHEWVTESVAYGLPWLWYRCANLSGYSDSLGILINNYINFSGSWQIKFDQLCLHWSCSSSNRHAPEKSRRSSSNAGKMDQTWSRRNKFGQKEITYNVIQVIIINW